MRRSPKTKTWRRLVLDSETPPAWLAVDSPHGDVVLSSRCRIARNLQGCKFPHLCDRFELVEIRERVLDAFSGSEFETLKHLNESERDFFVGARLISPEFEFEAPGRGLLLSKARDMSVLINEEDHLRVQALTAGWSAEHADVLANHVVEQLGQSLDFAWSPRFGYLTASPFNVGQGRRLSAMFHLIGIAHQKRLQALLKALHGRGITTRGLFGESSRAIGAFLQVSVTTGTRADFVGACDYLIAEERKARAEVGLAHVRTRIDQTLDFIQSSPRISLSDSLRALGWVRWGAVFSYPQIAATPREVDATLSMLEVRGDDADESSGRLRANDLRSFLGL